MSGLGQRIEFRLGIRRPRQRAEALPVADADRAVVAGDEGEVAADDALLRGLGDAEPRVALRRGEVVGPRDGGGHRLGIDARCVVRRVRSAPRRQRVQREGDAKRETAEFAAPCATLSQVAEPERGLGAQLEGVVKGVGLGRERDDGWAPVSIVARLERQQAGERGEPRLAGGRTHRLRAHVTHADEIGRGDDGEASEQATPLGLRIAPHCLDGRPLHAQRHGQRRSVDHVGGSPDSLRTNRIARVPLEHRAIVPHAGVSALHDVQRVALGAGEQGAAVVLLHLTHERFRRWLAGQQRRRGRHGRRFHLLGEPDRLAFDNSPLERVGHLARLVFDRADASLGDALPLGSRGDDGPHLPALVYLPFQDRPQQFREHG